MRIYKSRINKPELNATTLMKFICEYKKRWDGNSPSYRKMAKHFKTSTSMIDYIMKQLYEQGFIKRMEEGQNGIIVVGGEWRMKR